MQVPFFLVFTKTDKKKKRCPSAAENIAAFKAQLLATWQVRRNAKPYSFLGTSSRECSWLLAALCMHSLLLPSQRSWTRMVFGSSRDPRSSLARP